MLKSSPQHPMANKSSKQILIRKMKHISQIDQQIRKNWKQLFKFMNQGKSIRIDDSPKRRLMTEGTQNRTHSHGNAKKINSIHSEMKREKVHERHRKNDQIFFKKRIYDVNNLLKDTSKGKDCSQGSGLVKKYSLNLESSKKVLQGSVPFMLRKRRSKVEKEMGVIDHFYNDSLKKIKCREDLKCSLNLQDRKELVNRMKGSKVYYQFLKEWRTDEQETI